MRNEIYLDLVALAPHLPQELAKGGPLASKELAQHVSG
jgi:hypothetical protein